MGDFALKYCLFVDLKRIPNTEVTSTVRKHLMGAVYKINEAIYESSVPERGDLSTLSVAGVRLHRAKPNTPKTE